MAGSSGRSGQGITIVFATSGFTALIRSIAGLEESRAAIETSHLALAVNSERTRVPGDLIDLSNMTIVYEFDQSFSTKPPITDDPETVTITFPLRAGEVTPATLAGSGFLMRRKGPDVEVNADETMMGESDLQFDGLTGPTYTAGA